ncbi:MAG TPA: GNAT family N-acetyltransferase [Glaciihabitans sp.]|jgi:putative acetyltransferase|nr:GNAT family N-acetyltransferase [Glaciihabitans sp.]
MATQIRSYAAADAEATLDVFLSAIRATAAADYSPEQIGAWASDDITLDDWALRRANANTVVALVDGAIAGFADVDTTGYIDMMFVHPAFARRGVASALMVWAIETAKAHGATQLTTHASITARPFFEAHGFVVTEERHPTVRGVELTNFAMNRPL